MKKSMNTIWWSALAFVEFWLCLTLIVSAFQAAQPWLTGVWSGWNEHYFTLCFESNVYPCLLWSSRIALVVLGAKMLIITKK